MIDSQFDGDKQRRIVLRLRQMLKFIGRHDCRLEMGYETDRLVKYLDLDDFRRVIEMIEDPILKCLAKVGGLAGLRQSEVYGIRKHQLKRKKQLLVDTQLLSDGTRRKPKGNKIRTAFLLPGGYEAIQEWLSYPMKVRWEYRKGKNKIPQTVRKACQKLFPGDEGKHLNFHDLRHVYGVHLVSKGVPTDLVAKAMGGTHTGPEVCRKHYQGFMISDTGMDTIATILGRNTVGDE